MPQLAGALVCWEGNSLVITCGYKTIGDPIAIIPNVAVCCCGDLLQWGTKYVNHDNPGDRPFSTMITQIDSVIEQLIW